MNKTSKNAREEENAKDDREKIDSNRDAASTAGDLLASPNFRIYDTNPRFEKITHCQRLGLEKRFCRSLLSQVKSNENYPTFRFLYRLMILPANV
jgi:hypothetical protein